MAEKLVTVQTFWEPLEAHIARIKLESEGIKCFIQGDNFVSTYPLCANAEGGVKLKVSTADLELASEVLNRKPQTDQENAATEPPATAEGKYIHKVCPSCSSENIEYQRFSTSAAFLGILLLRIPFLMPGKKRCLDCNCTWR